MSPERWSTSTGAACCAAERGPLTLRWAIIPTAGRGARLAPATDVVPKVLLPVGLRPMLDWAVDEALDAGARDIIVIVSPGHPAVRDRVERRSAASSWPAAARLHVVEQPTAAGVGEALMRCRSLTAAAPFGVVVPDNWFEARPPALAQIAATHARTGLSTIGLVEVGRRNAALLGNVGGVQVEALGGVDYRVLQLADKASGAFEAPHEGTVLRGCARYVLEPTFYDALEKSGPPAEGEWDDVPAFQRLCDVAELAGCRLNGEFFDVGQEAGYLAAMSFLFEKRLSDSGA